ncbi:MAG: hypothetical protein KKI08_12580 [Armatimonadetes bacterium]|nr:hypothetical protein [Armatimonadota bacterium]
MAGHNVTVTLDEAERLELEQIVMDRDEKAALAFLANAVLAKIESAERGHMKSVFDTGGAPPPTMGR